MGPGKPYWKRPEGSTGALLGVLEGVEGELSKTCEAGTGTVTGEEVRRGARVEDGAIGAAVDSSFFLLLLSLPSPRREYMAAVAAAPAPALTAAMTARVALDISGLLVGGLD